MLSFGHICFWSQLFLKRSLFQECGQLCRTPRTGSCFKRFSSHRRFGTWNHWYEEPKPSHFFWHLITLQSRCSGFLPLVSQVYHPTWLRDREPREPREPHYLNHCNCAQRLQVKSQGLDEVRQRSSHGLVAGSVGTPWAGDWSSHHREKEWTSQMLRASQNL